jgi:hypothetical protein
LPFIVAAKELAFVEPLNAGPPVAVALAFAGPPSIAVAVAVAFAGPVMPVKHPKGLQPTKEEPPVA